jgi:predicted kinase
MAQEFAKKFYDSKIWNDVRNAYFIKNFGLCEICERPGEEVHHKIFLTPINISDTNITCNEENLQLLCKSCHNAEHNRAYEMHREKRRKNIITDKETCFDENGDLILKKSVTVIWGAPCSGKTTYVINNKNKYDIVVDLDYIMSALSLSNTRLRSPDTFPFALDVTKLLYDLISDRTYFYEHAWVVAMLPNKVKRNQLINKLKANDIYIDTPIEICKERAKLDLERKDKVLQYKIIEKFFLELEI